MKSDKDLPSRVLVERICFSKTSSFRSASSCEEAFVDKRSVTSPTLAYGAMVGSVWLIIKSFRIVTN